MNVAGVVRGVITKLPFSLLYKSGYFILTYSAVDLTDPLIFMCYSAQVIQAYSEYCDHFGAEIDIETFAKLYGMKLYDNRVKTTPALDATLMSDTRKDMQSIREAIDQFRAQQMTKLAQELEEQRERLAIAELALQTKTTKKSTNDKRIASSKIERALEKLAAITSNEPGTRDSRMYPGYYVPVMVLENGKNIVRPMRYQCRIEGAAEDFDTRFPGTYNARLDNLDGFWRNQFGHTHGVAIVTAFYEYITTAEGKKTILEFTPKGGHYMYVACLWSYWTSPGKDSLYSFAFITDDPPAEVLAAGHDRCIIPLKRENVDAWLAPDPRNLADMYAILDDRERPYYEHRVANK
jgi:putative SOS response-associated peptidase YedK